MTVTETVEVPVKCVEDPPTLPAWTPPAKNPDGTWTFQEKDVAKLSLIVHLMANWIRDAVERCQVNENAEMSEMPAP